MKGITTIIFFLLVTSAKARNFYFSTSTGDDNRSSTLAQSANTPWKTLSKLNSFFSSLLPGDSVLFKRGETFYGQIITAKSGTVNLPIIIGAYGTGSKPIITSLVNLVNPVQSGNVWTFAANSSLLSTCNIVVTNGVTLNPLGRYPNLSAANKGYLVFESRLDSTSITDNDLPLTPNWAGASALIRRDQTNFEEGLISLQANTTLFFNPKLPKTPVAKMGYFFQKDPRTLDFNGEWYYKASTKQVMLYSTTTPTNVQAAALNNLVISTTFSYITFTGIEFRGSNEDCFNIGRPATAGPVGVGGTGIKIENCDINFSGGTGIFSSRHAAIQVIGTTINNSMVKGMDISGTRYGKVRNCIVKNTRQIVGMGSTFVSNTCGTGIFYSGLRDTIENNLLTNSGSFGILFTGDSMIIKNNVVDTFGNKSSDVGGIYCEGASGLRDGCKIIGNIVKNGLPGATEGGLYVTLAQTAGIYLDNNASDIDVEDNTVTNCYYGILLHRGHGHTIRNNTFYSNTIQQHILSDEIGTQLIRGLNVKNNIYFGRLTSQMLSYLRTYNNDLRSFGTFDSNYFCRPISEPQGINNAGSSTSGAVFQINAGANGYYSLDKFQIAYAPYEANSKKTAKGYDFLRFEANTSYRDSVVTLNSGSRDFTWIDAKGVRVKGTLTLAPYTSVILIRDTIVPVAVTPNVPPTVSITSPANGTSYVAPGTVNITATASDADGTVSIVRFYSGPTLIGSDNSSPYTFNWTGLQAGGYSITAHAVDNSGDSTISAAVGISVIAVNVPPTVSITSPANGSTFSTPADITLEADANDANDSVLVVNFYENSIWIGNDSVRPYVLDISGRITGTYNYYAVAKDYAGDSTTSASITVTVNPPPPLAINIDAAAILCNGGSTIITISATGGTAPYTGIGSNVVSAGTYTYIVEDFDGTKDTAIVTVSQPAALSLTDSIGAIGNYAGSTEAHIFPTGGTAPYEYQINNGAWQTSNIFIVQAGSYMVNVRDANGCSDQIFFSVTQPVSTGPLNMSIRRVGKHINVNR